MDFGLRSNRNAIQKKPKQSKTDRFKRATQTTTRRQYKQGEINTNESNKSMLWCVGNRPCMYVSIDSFTSDHKHSHCIAIRSIMLITGGASIARKFHSELTTYHIH
mmetsp:Transcript_43048/g.69015  ORF Transcript_43048/g.69015 Transcript_43048/m.69015 type:complete len:106 (-) Transcript_43048:1044-1361(-)